MGPPERLASHSLINPGSLTPIKVVFAICGLWAIFYALAPVELWRASSDYPYLMLGLCFAGLLCGLLAFEPLTIAPIAVDPEERYRSLRRIYEIAFYLGLAGIALRVGDWVFLRGLTIDTDFLGNREKIQTAGSNALSMASTLLVPFTLVPYMVHAVARRNGERIGSVLWSVGLAALWPLLTIVIGSRSSMFISLGMMVIARLTIYPRTSRRVVAICGALAIGLVYAGGLLFIARLQAIGLRLEEVIKLSAFTHLVPVTQAYFNIASGLSDWGRDTLFIGTTFVQYVLHGVPEFAYLVEHYHKGMQGGAYTFSLVPRLAATLWGESYDPSVAVFSTPRVGIYTTMFGPFYVDFGPIVPAFCFGLGALVSWTRRCVLRGDFAALPLYICFVMQLAAAPVLNAMQNAYGIFYNLGFGLFWLAIVLSRPRKRAVPAEA